MKKNCLVTKGTAGQAIVEMAIIAPVLIVMMLGVFEVGWYIRAYLITLNATRETARMLGKEGVYSPEDGYGQFLNSLADQVPFDGAVSIRMHDVSLNNPFVESDDMVLIREPYLFGDGTFEYVMSDDELVAAMIVTTQKVNEDTYYRELDSARSSCLAGNDKYCGKWYYLRDSKEVVCEIHLNWSQERLIAVEASYDNPQLFGFFGSHEIPVKVHTVMKETRSRCWQVACLPRVVEFGDGQDGLEPCRD